MSNTALTAIVALIAAVIGGMIVLAFENDNSELEELVAELREESQGIREEFEDLRDELELPEPNMQ